MSAIDSAVAGDIAALGLNDWWFSAFSEDDQEWMANTYAPLGMGVSGINSDPSVGVMRRPLIDGTGCNSNTNKFKYLSAVAVWFNRPGRAHCAIAFINKSVEFIDDDLEVLDRHFALANHCAVLYRWRDQIPGALDGAIAACEMCIAIQEEAAYEAKAFFGSVPAHACFRQLRIIEEKRGNYVRAIELCQQAQAGGWAGTWDKDIARLSRKIAADRSDPSSVSLRSLGKND
jgi:hypothetical protein